MYPGNNSGYPYGAGGFNSGGFAPQPQKMLNKQQQALAYSYETLGNLLSAAENFAGLSNEQYGHYNISTAESSEELKSEFAWELHCFQLALSKYKNKYGEYIFPKGYSKEKIIKDCERYIAITPNQKDKILYYSMINIINGNKSDIDFDKLFEKLDKTPDKNFDPNKLVKIIGPLNHILSEIEKEAEEGEITFNEANKKSKARNKLKEESEDSQKLCSIVFGTKGFLYPETPSGHFYRFKSEDNKIDIDITIDETINDRIKKVYNARNKGKQIKIYINSTNAGFFLITIFDNDLKDYPKSEIILTDNKSGYGYINLNKYKQVPILLIDDLK